MMTTPEAPIKFAYWVPNVSGGLVISNIEQRTGWDIDYNRKLAQIAEASGFDYALSQIRFTAGYGADNQHESVSFSHALAAATEQLTVIAALLPGPWNPALAAKQIATINHLTGGRIAVNVVSGWFRGEFAAIGEPWLDHDERYRRSEEFIRGAARHLDRGPLHLRRRLLPLPQLFDAAEADRSAAGDLPGRLESRRRATWRRGCRTGTSPTATPRKASASRSRTSARRRQPRAGRSRSASTPSPSPARPRPSAKAVLDEIIAKANPDAVHGFAHEVKNAGKASPEGEGNWAKSSFEDLVQYNDGFRTNLIGTPEQIAERIIARQGRRRRPGAARLPALPGGGRVLRPAGDPAGARARGRARPGRRSPRNSSRRWPARAAGRSADNRETRMDGAFLRAEMLYRARRRDPSTLRRRPSCAGAGGTRWRSADIELTFGGVRALKGVSLDVRRGEIRAVIGPNGAGKSSLVNIISGLYRADAGSIADRRRELSPGAGAPAGASSASRAPSRTWRCFPASRCAPTSPAACVHTRSAGLRRPDARPAARPARGRARSPRRSPRSRRLLHLEAHLDRPAGKLPYGLQKRVELARALVARAGAPAPRRADGRHDRDGEGRDGRLPARSPATERPFSVILIEHDIGVVMDLSDRVAVLDYGRKIADGTPDEVRARPRGHPSLYRRRGRLMDWYGFLFLVEVLVGGLLSGRHVLAGRDRLRADLQDLGRAELRAGRDGALRGADLRQPGRARLPLRRARSSSRWRRWRSSASASSARCCRPLVNRSPMTLFMATLGLSWIIEGAAQLLWGTQVHRLDLGISNMPFEVAGVFISTVRPRRGADRRRDGRGADRLLPLDPHRPRLPRRRRRPVRGAGGRAAAAADLGHGLDRGGLRGAGRGAPLGRAARRAVLAVADRAQGAAGAGARRLRLRSSAPSSPASRSAPPRSSPRSTSARSSAAASRAGSPMSWRWWSCWCGPSGLFGQKLVERVLSHEPSPTSPATAAPVRWQSALPVVLLLARRLRPGPGLRPELR